MALFRAAKISIRDTTEFFFPSNRKSTEILIILSYSVGEYFMLGLGEKCMYNTYRFSIGICSLVYFSHNKSNKNYFKKFHPDST